MYTNLHWQKASQGLPGDAGREGPGGRDCQRAQGPFWEVMDIFTTLIHGVGLPWWLSGTESACSAGDLGLIPWLGSSPGGGSGNPLQCSCLEKPMDRQACQATVDRVHGVTKRVRHDLATKIQSWCVYAKTHQIASCEHVQFIIHQLYLHKNKQVPRKVQMSFSCWDTWKWGGKWRSMLAKGIIKNFRKKKKNNSALKIKTSMNGSQLKIPPKLPLQETFKKPQHTPRCSGLI